jgi:glutamate racemase
LDMKINLMAGKQHQPVLESQHHHTILVFDSGIGGLSVLDELRKARPFSRFVYVADNAAFPYGRLTEAALVARVIDVMGRSIETFSPDLVVVACNTASTLVLPHLRDLFDVPFVGTVPAIKPAALASRTKCISVLATPGTVARDYTHDLIRSYANNCHVTLVGSQMLAGLAESEIAGQLPSDEDIWRELAPCFVEEQGLRTDTIVLGCTHYPMLRHRFDQLAPWTVAWIDSGPAIARRVGELLGADKPIIQDNYLSEFSNHVAAETRFEEGEDTSLAIFTSSSGVNDTLVHVMLERGMSKVTIKPMPLDM